MRKIILNPQSTLHEINYDNLDSDHVPIIAKLNGKLRGYIVHEKRGWILKIGGSGGAYGFFDNLIDLLRRGERDYGYTFYTN